jgi:hypothetical protein
VFDVDIAIGVRLVIMRIVFKGLCSSQSAQLVIRLTPDSLHRYVHISIA